MQILRYRAPAQILHWLTLFLLIGSFAIGFWMVDQPFSPLKLRNFSYHKWIGVSIFLVALLRLCWRWYSPAPPLPPGIPAWQCQVSSAVHWLLYALLVAIPLTGWVFSSARGFSTVVFGLVKLPDLVGKNEPFADFMRTIHFTLNKTLLVLVAAHATAALKHQFVDRDGVLARMLPRWLMRGAPAVLVAAFLTLHGTPPALAAGKVDLPKSSVVFAGRQMGVDSEGRFERFSADVTLDEKNPPKSSARVVIEIASINSGTPEGDQELMRKLWFNTEKFPKAEFQSGAFRATGPGKYEATGKLTIKGRTRDVTVPFTVSDAPGGGKRLRGVLTIKRLEFGVGEGIWADTDTVADEVQIRFDFRLRES